jgi:hypothetical protein
MNDQIAKLKAQCIVREQRGTNAFDSYMVDRFDTEKFAELIVRECADQLIKWKDEPFPYDPEFGARLIKQHFGVEE